MRLQAHNSSTCSHHSDNQRNAFDGNRTFAVTALTRIVKLCKQRKRLVQHFFVFIAQMRANLCVQHLDSARLDGSSLIIVLQDDTADGVLAR